MAICEEEKPHVMLLQEIAQDEAGIENLRKRMGPKGYAIYAIPAYSYTGRWGTKQSKGGAAIVMDKTLNHRPAAEARVHRAVALTVRVGNTIIGTGYAPPNEADLEDLEKAIHEIVIQEKLTESATKTPWLFGGDWNVEPTRPDCLPAYGPLQGIGARILRHHAPTRWWGKREIDWMINKCGLMIIDIEFNDVNGGSFSVTASHKDSQYSEFTDLKDLLIREQALGLDSIDTYKSFASRVKLLRNNLKEFIYSESSKGKQFACLGASTKGNVILQYCSLTADTIIAVGEVNPEKYGKYTPNTLIPILPESDLLDMGVDYIIVLPWHFRPYFEIKLSDITSSIIFPLPELSIINNA